MYNIAVVGMGYVGLSMAVLLSLKNKVIALDVVEERVCQINEKKSPISDEYIEKYLQNKDVNLTATMDEKKAYKNADFIIIAVPTSYDMEKNAFDVSIVESVLSRISKYNKAATIIIKSTIPIEFTVQKNKFLENTLLFSPEFLREGRALYDNLYPSRIIVGVPTQKVSDIEQAKTFASILKDSSQKKDVDILIMGATEAESVKLFANTYLAMRVAYFNELDLYAEEKGLSAKDIITGISLDPRIGNIYNNPSFGYGGYCLPKDTKQLLTNYQGIPQRLISAIVDSNEVRKKYVAIKVSEKITQMSTKKIPVLGIYRLIMKSGSDNFRDSAILGIIDNIDRKKIKCIIYEPTIRSNNFNGLDVCNEIDEFKKNSDCIITNRYEDKLDDVINKVYTRDIFLRD